MEAIAKSPARLVLLLILAVLLGAAAVIGVQALGANGTASTGEKARIEGVVRDYVLAHPEIIPEAMDRLRERETVKTLDANRGAITTPFPGAIAGNPKGDLTMVAYLDYACGYCRASLPAIEQLIREEPRLKVVYRELPILSQQSVTAARWALAAAEQGKFKRFHDAVYAGGQLSEASIQAAAQQVGLDKARAAKVAQSAAVEQEIARNRQSAQAIGLTGTPTWVIGKEVMSGAVGYDALKAALDKSRKGGA